MSAGLKIFAVICVVIGLLIGGCVVVTGGLFTMGLKKAAEMDAAEKQTVADAIQSNSTVGVNVSAFLKEFDANKVAADEKYKGKVLTLSGVVASISDSLGQLSVNLAPNAKSFESVAFFFDDSDKGEITKLAKGQTVKIAGLYRGGSLLVRCRVVK